MPFTIGPPQPDMGLVVTVPSAAVRSKVPQNANDVLVDLVVLSIDKVSVLVTVVFGSHALQGSPLVIAAPTSARSFEVQELADGKVVVVCANAAEKNKRAARKNSSRFINSRLIKFLHFGDDVGEWARRAGFAS